MSGLDKVQLIGRLGADPETRDTSSGSVVTNLRIATSEDDCAVGFRSIHG